MKENSATCWKSDSLKESPAPTVWLTNDPEECLAPCLWQPRLLRCLQDFLTGWRLMKTDTLSTLKTRLKTLLFDGVCTVNENWSWNRERAFKKNFCRKTYMAEIYSSIFPLGSLPLLSTPPLWTCYLNLLFPAVHERQALIRKTEKTNLTPWNLSQRTEEDLCNPLNALCVWPRPKCFLQNRCNRESRFLRWSLCFWAVMKRGKAQTQPVWETV